jgi:hypothetical protein
MSKQVITIRGRNFEVSPLFRTNPKGEQVRFFELKGVRGAHYFTMTNVHSGLHFIFNGRRARGTLPLDGVWLKDNDGVLEVVSQ